MAQPPNEQLNRDSPHADPSVEGDAPFIMGGGEAGALIRSIDWCTSQLGPARDWPQSLRTAINICVASRFPIALYWGPQFVMLYNDDLVPMVGTNKHPWAMGKPAFEVLPEIRGLIEPLLRRVLDTGEAIWSENLMLPLLRSDGQAESYFTFTYSPVHDESGSVGGVFCAVLETHGQDHRLPRHSPPYDCALGKAPLLSHTVLAVEDD